jgi:uncharacterized protein (DUF697 family)
MRDVTPRKTIGNRLNEAVESTKRFATKKFNRRANQEEAELLIEEAQKVEMARNAKVMTPEQLTAVNKAVHGAALAAAAVAITPIPFADAVILTPIQIRMIQKIYSIFGQEATEGFIKGLVIQTLVPNVGRSLAGNLIKFIPGAGSIAGAGINTAVAVGITEAMGWGVANLVARGMDIDLDSLNDVMKDALKDMKKK